MTRVKLAACLLFLASMPRASGVPIQFMSNASLAIEYEGLMAGQKITDSAAHSLFNAHYFMVRYAPVPYLLVSAGIGGTKFAEYNRGGFRGTPGISTAGGIEACTPRIFNFLIMTADADFYLLNSSRYRSRRLAMLADPGAGMRLLIGDFIDFEGGVRGHILDGKKNVPKSAGSVAYFSNNNRFRAYTAVTLHSLSGNAYVTLSLDMSREAGSDWANGPEESSLALQVGACINPFRNRVVIDEKEEKIDGFAAYDTLKAEQSDLAKQLRKKR